MRLLMVIVLFSACGDGPDLVGPPKPSAAVVGTGCAVPDAGAPDALDCTCPDRHGNCALPACGVFCCF
jgi:hypothetical protein